MGALTKLEAVNRILRSAGEFPVSTLNSASNDTLLAEQTLDEQTLYANMEGDLQNTTYSYITPQTDGRFVLSSDLLHIETVGVDINMIVSTRGNNPTYLYDVANNTTYFLDSLGAAITKLHVQQVIRLAFEDMPTQAQFAVTDTAARMYQMQTVGDMNQDALLSQQAMHSSARSRQADARQRKANFLNGLNSNAWNSRHDPYGYNPRLGY
jgi:hypothetical protein